MSFGNNSIKCVKNSCNLNDEKTSRQLMSDEKTSNECNFWELITDVAKDLDLALQDLSPDFEISKNISHGIIDENADNNGRRPERSGSSPEDTLLFESIAVGIAGNDSQQQTKPNTDPNHFHNKPYDHKICAEVSPDKTPTLSQTNSCALLPTFTAHSSSVSSSKPMINSSTLMSSQTETKKPSYSSQLLSVMDNFGITSHNSESLSKCNAIEIKEKQNPSEVESLSNNTSIDDKNDDNSDASCESIPATIGLLEHLIRCHPIWFLSEIGRGGVVHLLQGKEPGCFIVRQSSKANTMALSVRLPEGRGPHIEHYLIEDGGSGKLHLEDSDNYFSAIPMLVSHYSTCCDELPVQLTLPKVLAQSNRQQLTSLALLGQDFWQSSLSKLTNSNDNKSDENSSETSNSLNKRSNKCSTFKKESPQPPPPIPPKQDVSNVDPIIDMKKSSTVPISQVLAPQQPKLPPKRAERPPVPPRSKFGTLNNGSISKSTNSSTNTSNESTKEVKEAKESPIAPNTEITLIHVKDVKHRRHSDTSSVSISSQTTDNTPKDSKISLTNAQKKVLCYRSSLHDKESDYEDIWGANTVSRLTLDSTLRGIAENERTLDKSHRSTQTETTVLKKNSTNRLNSFPFYMDPIDAINKRVESTKSSLLRRSDTDINDAKPLNSSLYGYSMESLIDCIRTESSQIDTCHQTFSTIDPNLQDVSLQVGISTFSRHPCNEFRETSWPLDKSWQWLNDNMSSFCGQPFRRDSLTSFRRSSFVESMKSDVTTVEDLITLQAPELCVQKVHNLSQNMSNNGSVENKEFHERYDNLAALMNNRESVKQEAHNDTDTEFSEPWDSEWWEGLLKKVFPKNSLLQFSPENEENSFPLNRELVNNGCENESSITSLSDSRRTSTFDITEVSSIAEMRSNASYAEHRESTASDRLTVLETNDCGIGLNICNYIFKLSAEGDNTFAKAVDHFIQCTQETNETNPIIVLRNIRQFMNGMKNYLVKHGEGELNQMVERERTKLKSNEFLNIDAILESALHRLVIKPLKNFLYQLFINEYNRNGSLKVLSRNIKEAQTKSPEELGVRPELLPIDHKVMAEIQKHLCRLQQSYSPLKKLEYLLSSISCIYNSVRQHQKKRNTNDSSGHQKSEYASFGADHFLPIFIYVLIQCGVISIEIEADYMLGLLHPSILCGEGGYYLTTLCSCVQVIKNMHQLSAESNTMNSTTDSNDDSVITSNPIPVQHMNSSSSETSVTSGSVGQHSPYTQIKMPMIVDMKAYMRVLIPDEFTSSISVKTLPVRQNMTAKEICKMIAHKIKITNPEDFGIFQVNNGEEIQLNDSDLPQVIKSEAMTSGRETQFAYKRFDAKFIWPIIKH